MPRSDWFVWPDLTVPHLLGFPAAKKHVCLEYILRRLPEVPFLLCPLPRMTKSAANTRPSKWFPETANFTNPRPASLMNDTEPVRRRRFADASNDKSVEMVRTCSKPPEIKFDDTSKDCKVVRFKSSLGSWPRSAFEERCNITHNIPTGTIIMIQVPAVPVVLVLIL
jgi:hypothetical protein